MAVSYIISGGAKTNLLPWGCSGQLTIPAASIASMVHSSVAYWFLFDGKIGLSTGF